MNGLINVKITKFMNPFSFFCIVADKSSKDDTNTFENSLENRTKVTKSCLSDMNHGQYVAVMWNKKWTRGIISMEQQCSIWLIDYGIFIVPDDRSVFTDLPIDYKKLPTKVFEAAVHGVNPLQKYISDEFQLENKVSTSWNKGALEKCHELLKSAVRIYLSPLALMSTKCNDIVLGDLYLEMPGKKIVNIVDELELWPVFLEKNKQVYVENLSNYYVSRNKHRACAHKPELAARLPTVSLDMTLQQYTALADDPQRSVPLPLSEPEDSDSDLESEVAKQRANDAYTLTPADIEKYSQMYITVHGEMCNLLNTLVNKARVLRMCERYKDHDLKSIGRGISSRRTFHDRDF